MIVSNEVNTYGAMPVSSNIKLDAVSPDTDENTDNTQERENNKKTSAKSSKVLTEPDGSTVMQYTSVSPRGSIMRKNVVLYDASAHSQDPLNPAPMLRRRSNEYESMMQVF